MINFSFLKKVKNNFLISFFKNFFYFFEFIFNNKFIEKNLFLKKKIFKNFFILKTFKKKLYFSITKKILFLFFFSFLKKIIIKKNKKFFYSNKILKIKKKELIMFISNFNFFNFKYKKIFFFLKIKNENFKNNNQKKIFYKKKRLYFLRNTFYSLKKIKIIGFLFIKKSKWYSYFSPYWFNFNNKKVKKFINFYFLKKKIFLLKRYFNVNFLLKNFNKKHLFSFSYLINKNKILNFQNIYLNKNLNKKYHFIKKKNFFYEINYIEKTKICLICSSSYNLVKIILNCFKKNYIELINYFKKKIFFVINKKINYIGYLSFRKKNFLTKIIEIILKKKNFFHYKKCLSLKIKLILLNYVNYVFNNKKIFLLKKNYFKKLSKNGIFNIIVYTKNMNIYCIKKKFFVYNIIINI
ncbi:hypothetical protein [Candidatus Carsonella ruddii]|uniref:hypothetical protein n=1 Tax=Carsonella ruddii TaxID=114186 RepID=UPI0006BDD043|nr:hypothetical protein [Candidatus Carsonella ruddii]ALA96845.1 hypothetical protein AMC76_00600 [Candidatus Carsonella ruddii]